MQKELKLHKKESEMLSFNLIPEKINEKSIPSYLKKIE
jgi:hypothetical protein